MVKYFVWFSKFWENDICQTTCVILLLIIRMLRLYKTCYIFAQVLCKVLQTHLWKNTFSFWKTLNFYNGYWPFSTFNCFIWGKKQLCDVGFSPSSKVKINVKYRSVLSNRCNIFHFYGWNYRGTVVEKK